MRKVCFLIVTPLLLVAAALAPLLIRHIPVSTHLFTTDNLGNAYIVTTENDLNKYNKQGVMTTTQNIKLNGKVSGLDATNAFELYVFYRELNKVVFMDNLLAYRGEIKFTDAGLGQVTAVGRSYDNGVWVFDINDLQLKKFDKSMELLTSSGNTKNFTDAPLNPNFILDNQDRVYVNNPETGIFVFDAFANYYTRIPVKGLSSFQVVDNQLYYFSGQTLYRYDMKLFREEKVPLPDTASLTHARMEKDRLYLLRPDTLSLYTF